MPQVPNPTPQISMNVPGVNAPMTRQFGKMGNAAEGLGQTIMGTGLSVLDTVKRAEANDAANNAYMEARVGSDKKIQDLKLQSPDGYIHEDSQDPNSQIVQNDDGTRRTITQEFHDWANDRYQNDQKTMPSELAAQMYRDRTLPYVSNQIALLQNDAQAMKVKSFDQNQQMLVKQSGDLLADNPGAYVAHPLGPNGESTGGHVDMSRFYDVANDHSLNRAAQIGTMYNATGAQEATFQDNQKLSYYAMQGAYTQAFADKKAGDATRVDHINAWLDVLHGKDPYSLQQAQIGKPTLSTMMDPTQKEREEDKLLRLLPGAKIQDKTDFLSHLADATAARRSGMVNPGQPTTSLESDPNLKELVHLAQLGPENGGLHRGEAIDKFAEYVAAAQEGSTKGAAWKNMGPDTQSGYINKSYADTLNVAQGVAKGLGFQWTDDEGARAANTLREKLLSMKATDDTEKKKDLAGYLMTPSANGQPTSQAADAFSKVIPGESMVSLQRPQNKQIIQNWLKQSKNTAQIIDPTNWHYTWAPMDKSLSSQWGSTLSDTNVNDQVTGSNFKGLINAFGKNDGGKAIDKMVDNGHLDQAWSVMSGFNPNHVSQQTLTQIMSAVRGRKAIDDQFKANSEATGVKESDLQGEVAKLTSPWAEARNSGNSYNTKNLNYQAAAIKVVTTYAKELYNSDTSLSASDAAQRAYNTILGKYVTPTKTGAPWIFGGNRGQGYSNEPNSVAGQPVTDQDRANIEHNMSKILSPDGLKSLHLDRPTVNGKPDMQDEHFEDSASRTAYRSYTSSPAPGYHLFYKYGDNQNVVPFTSNGRPVFIPYADAVRGSGAAAPPVPQKYPPMPKPSVPARGGLDKL